ncbi:MAG: alpha/beta hydrolase [Anaerolinea sp.]|nr:alpha/beta hydrolase [Anaerolinea sp.]
MNSLHTHPDFPSQYVPPRRVDVWLPPQYDAEENGRFPTLTMHDGQNLFTPEHAYGGVTWGVAEAVTRLSAAGEIAPVIIIGIWNAGDLRWPEYLPERPFTTPAGQQQLVHIRAEFAEQSGTAVPAPHSDNYLRFLVQELKPFIDQTYRTRPEREATFIMGSSMGGLISLYALCEYPDVFAGAGCLSTHWPAVKSAILPYLHDHLPAPGRHKLYFDYGTAGLDAAYEPHQLAVDALLQQRGYTSGQHWLTRQFPGADHNEAAWQARVYIPLTFLMGKGEG